MKRRCPTYLDKIGHGKRCGKPPADYVAFGVGEDDELRERCVGVNEWGTPSVGGSRVRPLREIVERAPAEPEDEETPDVFEMMNGRER